MFEVRVNELVRRPSEPTQAGQQHVDVDAPAAAESAYRSPGGSADFGSDLRPTEATLSALRIKRHEQTLRIQSSRAERLDARTWRIMHEVLWGGAQPSKDGEQTVRFGCPT